MVNYIDRKNPVDIAIVRNQATKFREKDKVAGKEAAPGSVKDMVSVSPLAGDILRAEGRLQEIPEIQTEKVAEISLMLADGSYKIDPDKIAYNIIKESLLDDLL